MTAKKLICAVVFMSMTLTMPSKAEALGPLIQRGLHEVGKWLNTPQGQETARKVVQSPTTYENAKKVVGAVSDAVSYVSDRLQEEWDEVSSWSPACTMCAMTGSHRFCGGP